MYSLVALGRETKGLKLVDSIILFNESTKKVNTKFSIFLHKSYIVRLITMKLNTIYVVAFDEKLI